MISGPSTEKILLDCARELSESVAPHVNDASTKALLAMLIHVLRNSAERSAHEIAWMIEERDEILSFAAKVMSVQSAPVTLESAIAAAIPPASLNLDDVIDSYRRASEVLSLVLEATMTSSNSSLRRESFDLLAKRVNREKEITLGWGEAEGLGATR